jgi:hypothetical protein
MFAEMETQEFQPWSMVWFAVGIIVWTIALFRIMGIVRRAFETQRWNLSDMFVLTFWFALFLGSLFSLIVPLIH